MKQKWRLFRNSRRNKRKLERILCHGLQKLEDRIVLDSSSFPTPLNPIAPFGSLVYQGNTAGSFLAPGETDDYSINLDANQKASVVFTPFGSLGASLRLLDSLNNIVASTSSSGDGQRTVLQTGPVSAAGNYKIEVVGSATSASGAYGVSLVLNAAVESELGAASNNTWATAQTLLSSSVSLGAVADRLAVLGTLGAADQDWYSFTLGSGDSATISLEGLQPGDVDVELFDASGTKLAKGVEGTATAVEHVAGFVATVAGNYFARVSGQSLDYNLVVTRNAAFDLGSNSTFESAQLLTGSKVAGAISGSDVLFSADFANGLSDSLDGFTATGLWHVTSVAPGADLPGHSRHALAYYGVDADGNFDAGNTAGALTSPLIVLPVGSSPSLSFVYRLQGEGGNPRDRADLQISTNNGSTWTALASNNDAIPIQLTDNNLVWTPITIGLSAYAGNTVRVRYFFNATNSINNTGLGWQVDDIAITGTDTVDVYSFPASAGNSLTLSTTTPGQGLGAPVNDLDPILELYSPSGNLVVSNNDNGVDLNALVNYTVPLGGDGVYTARLARVTGAGDYVLSVNGATGTQTVAQAVVASSIRNDAVLGVAPTELSLTFSEPVLLTSVSLTDLQVNGYSVPLLRVDDGRTLVFDLTAVVTADGNYSVSLAAGAISSLLGQGNGAFPSAFRVDTTAPRVVSTSVGQGASVNPGNVQLTVEFDEDLDFSKVDYSDINIFSSEFGTYYADSINFTASSVTANFSFVPEGNFELRLRSAADAFKDFIGHILDGENGSLPSGNGVPGGDFVLNFVTDVGVYNWSQSFEHVQLNAGLIYQSSNFGKFDPASDPEIYVLPLDAGQSLSARLFLFDAALAASIKVTRPDLTEYTVTGAVGETLILNGVPVNQAGSYSIEVVSVEGVGAYRLELSLNSEYENENYLGGDNDSTTAAQELTFADVGASVEHAAVLGVNSFELDEDYYSFTLNAGQSVSLSLGQLQSGGEAGINFFTFGPSSLHLLNDGGAPLATAEFLFGNPGELINDFVAPYTGTYYAHVRNFGSQDYALEVVKQAAFQNQSFGVEVLIPQNLPSSGRVSGYLGGFNRHDFWVNVNSSDALAINVQLPGEGPGEFINGLYSTLRLYDENGLQVATSNTGAIEYEAVSTGQYSLSIEANSFDFGNYLLTVSGATGPEELFLVDFVSVDDGAKLSFSIEGIEIDFNDGFRLDTLSADDILIDGSPVLGYELLEAGRLSVLLPALGEGNHTLSIAAGVILDWQGTPNEAFTSSFEIDLTAPRVATSSLLDGQLADTGTLTYLATFSEELQPVESGRFTLSGPGGNRSPNTINYNAATSQLTLTFLNITEGNYTLSFGSLYDIVGNELDGEYQTPLPSGNGIPGGDFSVTFFVDHSVVPYPTPLIALGIDGGLVYDPPVTGSFIGTNDVDEFSISLDGNQKATVILKPNDPSIATHLEFRGPSGLLQSFDSAAGATAFLQNVTIAAAGNYSIRASQITGSGSYTLELILNSSYESETLGGSTNDTTATAEAIDSSAYQLAVGADRLSVVGQTEAAADNFAFQMQAGQLATLALLAIDKSPLQLELYDASNRLAFGTSGALNAGATIRDFRAPVTGTYFARVSGATGKLYHLLVTRGAAFDLEPNNQLADVTANPLLTGTALGYLGGAGIQVGNAAYLRSTVGRPWGSTAPEAAMDKAFGVGAWADLRFETVNVATLFGGAYAFIYMEGSDSSANEMEAFLNANRTAIEAFVAAGNTLFMNSAPNEGDGMSYGFGGVQLVYQDFSSTGTVINASHPIHVGPFLPTATTYSCNFFTHSRVQGGGITPILRDSTDDAVLAELKWGSGTVLFGGMTTTNFHSPQPASLNVRANTLFYAASQAGDGVDLYQISVLAGSVVTIQTSTPGDGPGEFVNLIDPEIGITNPSGVAVPHVNVVGNESFSFTAATAGAYTIRVSSRTSKGTYVLNVSGNETISHPLTVTTTTPATGSLLVTPPATYRMTFSHPLLLSTVQASDLTVDGIPADSVTVVDGMTLEFVLTTANTGDGLYTAVIPAGAISSLAGSPLAAFSATYDADATNPTVISSSISQGGTVAPGPLSFLVTFSEELAQSGLGAEDVTLVEALTGQVYTPSSFTYTPGTSTLKVDYSALPEGNYTITVLTSATAFRDRRGNLLQGGNFVRNFTVDVTTAPLSPIVSLTPRGSLVYTGAEQGVLNASNDVDVFEVSLDAGQSARFRFAPISGSIRARIEVLDPSGAQVGSAEAAAAGDALLLDAISINTAGNYRLRAISLAGAGGYTVELLLNTLLETAGNNSLATAQDMTGSGMSLPRGADRLAVLGQTQAGVDDYYSVTLSGGQYLSVGLANLAGGNAMLAMFDAAGVQVALGQAVQGGQGVNWKIQDFLADSAGGQYKLRVSGPTGVAYSLFATRGAAFDAESNDADAQAQYLGNTLLALGAIQANELLIEPDKFPNGTNLSDAFPGVTLSNLGSGNVLSTTSGLASTGGRVFSVNGSVDWTSPYSMLQANFAFPVSQVSIDVIGDDGSDPGVLQAFNSAGVMLEQFVTPAAGPVGVPRTMTIARAQADIAFIRASGLNGDTANLDNLRILGDFADVYSFDATEGSVIDIRTTTPLDGPGEPTNLLDPLLEVINAGGFLVASDDNSAGDARNARTTFTVPAGGAGTYIVRVKAQTGTTGEYTLNVQGATQGVGPSPTVTSTTPTNGQRFLAPPTSITLKFSEAIRPDSVSAADLIIDGGASVSGVEIVDATTLRFSISVPNIETVYAYSLPAGAVVDLQGQGSLSYSGAFVVDKTGPRIVSQAPALQASAPFTHLIVVFDEAIDAATFTTADIASFTGPGGTNLLSSITSVTGAGNTFTVTFNSQTAVGTYTLVLGPNITDISGNAMNQNGNTINGESGDAYTATVALQSPDLTLPIAIGSPSIAVFGQPITVSWTVQNTGTDPAREAWSDRVYLSSNATLEEGIDILLTTVGAGVNSPLGVSASYSRSVSVTLPLQTSLSSGTYFVIVKSDALNQQPESNEANNVRASAAVAVTLPLLPDLVVSNIQAPIDAFAGQQIAISWTLTNQGTGPASGTWVDQLFLSADNAPGGDQYFGGFTFTGTIGAGQSVTRTQTITLPQNLQGNRWVVVATDVNNSIYEHANEGNNVTVDNAPIDVRIPPLPNLQVTSVTAPPTAFSSQGTQVQWITTNNGTGATSAPAWYDAVYFSLDTILDASDTFMGEVLNPSYLGASESYASSLNLTLPRGIEGNYHFLIRTDWRNQVFEFENEGDNLGVGAATFVQLTPPPDLRVTLVQPPAISFSGQPISVNWTVQNQGSGRTLENTWYDDVYMSVDDVLNTTGDYYLGRRLRSGVLESNATYAASLGVTLPIGVIGPFYFFVRTDSFGQVYEHAAESNNDGRSAQVNVLLTPPPDLEVTSVTGVANATAGRSYTVSFSVENFGATGTPNSSWLDSIYLSGNTTLDAGDIKVADVTRSGALPDGGFYDRTVSFTVPNGLQGAFYVLVHTDSSNVVFELDNANNVGFRASPVTIISLPADLVVTGSAPASAEAGKSVRVDYTVSNIGVGDTIATSWVDSIYASSDANFSGGDVLLSSFTQNGAVIAGSSYGRSQLVDIPFSFLGNYHLFVVTDRTGVVFESNEANNVSTPIALAVTRQVPDLQVTSVTAPPTAQAGTDMTVSWTVRNFGANRTNSNFWYDEIWLSNDGFISNDDFRLGNIRRANALDPLAEYTATSTFRLPDNRSGPLQLIVRTDATNQVFEDTLEGNNDRAVSVSVAANPAAVARPDLEVVTVIAPNDGLSGQGFSLTWTVRNNDVGTTRNWYDAVYLSRDQIFDRDADTYLGFRSQSGLASGSSYTATQSFTVPNGLTGPFYVFVAADSGQSVDEAGRKTNNVGFDSGSMLVSLAPPADLVVGTITVPANASLGRTATMQYTITNQGANAARGSWYDSVFFSTDDQWDVGDVLFGRNLHVGDVAGGANYSASLTATVPGINPGDYRIIIRSDIRNNIPESNESNNIGASLDLVDVDIESLVLGVPTNDSLFLGKSSYYRVEVSSGETLVVTLDSASSVAANELYVRYGDVPTRAQFDYAFSDPLSSDQRILVPFTRGGTYYILAYGASGATPANYSITAAVPTFSILDVGPDAGSNQGLTTVRITGSRFVQGGQIDLSGPGGTRLATQVWWKDSSEVWATFDLRGLATGTYSTRIHQGIDTAIASNSFTVNADNEGELSVQVNAPSTLRPGQPGVVTVNYANSGNTDIAAPVLTLAVTNALLRLNDGSDSRQYEFLGISPSGPAGILAPGARGSVSLVYNPTVSDGEIAFQLSELPANQPIDWAARKAEARPAGTSSEAWDIIWANYTAGLGTTGAGLRAALDENANHLSQIGMRVNDSARLLRFELQQANGSVFESVQISPASAGNAIDIAATADSIDFARQLPLFLARTYGSGIEGRFREGAFGLGWTHNWEISVEEAADGMVTFYQGAGSRVFVPRTGGGYQGLPDETGVLTKEAGRFRLVEPAGIAYQMGSDGGLESVSDSYDNQLTLTHTSGRLTRLVHTDGESLTISYNAAGRISQVVDDVGRSVSYLYDATGQHLTSVTREDGVTSYAYQSAAGASQHALLSITHPDGALVSFQYDATGRQTGHALNGGDESMTYAYDSSGGMTLTDRTGNISRILLTDAGASGRVTDAKGNVTQLFYNDRGLLTQSVNPAGATSTFIYDAQGNLLSNQDALGQTVSFTYDSALQQIRTIRDPLGRTLRYAYDARGNLLSVAYPDGTTERYTVSAATGVTDTTTNRRNQETRLTYDARGRVIRKDFADSTFATFSYDANDNLLTAADADSSVTYTYDALKRLQRVSYDTGRFVEFQYDTIGRRTQVSDGMGYIVNYVYTTAGRLDELKDAAGDSIVKYFYDVRGSLAREDNGNGTSTTYAYGPTNQLLSVVNYRDDGSTVNSRFDYTYDKAGRRTSMTTLSGVTTYGYDATGQLTLVTMPGRTIEYRYDAAGNRIAVNDSGATTSYAVNNLNEYTSVGGTVYSYDSDGNLVAKTIGGVSWTYNFDSENRMTRAESSAGEIWQYVYDALGNRVASIRNGQRTDFVIDPTGWGDVIAEYGPAGQVSHFSYGVGLVGQIAADGSKSYYDFDAMGNTVGISGVGGSYLNSYSYLPFGESLLAVEGVANSFEFGGQWGVSRSGDGLDYMRARYYDAATGRFVSVDPLRVQSGDINYYRFAQNNPVSANDPTGQILFVPILVGAGVGAVLDIGVQLATNGGDFGNISWGSVAVSAGLGALGGGIGSAGARRAGVEFSHWIPGRFSNPNSQFYKGIPRWLTENSLNGNHVPRWLHAATDPYRLLKGMKKWGDHLYPAWQRQLIRMPGWLSGGLLGPLGGALTRLIRPIDPNDIVGPKGFGDEHWVTASETLPYTIRFENRAAATAPAQQVRITHPLDSDLDPRTFRLGNFGFKNLTFEVPANQAFFAGRLDVRKEMGIFVDVLAGIDVSAGEAFWILTAIDPDTGEQPEDASVGFLPPNDADHAGEGFVTYTVRSRRTIQTGTVIDALATIIFDTEEPLSTPPIFNTVDALAPSSQVTALPALVSSVDNSVLVQWTGSDDQGGSALDRFTIYVSDNGGPFAPWLEDTQLIEATYVGLPGHTYAFYSRSRDNAGNLEAPPAAADTETTIGVGDVTPPEVLDVIDITPDPRNASVATAEFEVSEELDLASLKETSLTLTRNGVAVTIPAGSVTFERVAGTLRYRVSGLGPLTLPQGDYVLTLNGPGLKDVAGNAGVGIPNDSWKIDTNKPTSAVSALALTQTSLVFPVTVTGSDPISGGVSSGLTSIEIYVSTNGGPWSFWRTVPPNATTANYTGVSNNTYSFYSTGRDVAGNVESKTPAAEATTYVPDLSPPTTQVTQVVTTTPTFNINMTGSDVAGSLAFFNLFVQIDNSPAQQVTQLTAGGATGGVYSRTTTYQAMQDGIQHTYRFYTIGVDARGNVESTPAAPADVVVVAQFAPPAALQVAAFDVQKNSTQRSFVRYIDVTFNKNDAAIAEMVASVNDANTTNDRIKLTRRNLDYTNPMAVSLATRVSAVDQVMAFDFTTTGIGGNRSSNVGDGYYELELDFDGDGTFDTLKRFYRLLGDVTGNGIVDATDVSAVEQWNQPGGVGLGADTNGDGLVNATDRTLTVRAVGRQLTGNKTLDD